MLDIYEYSDYRAYLKESFRALKEQDKKISLAYIASKVGQTKSAVQFILDEQRHLTLDKTTSYAKLLELNDDEAEYFHCMVGFNRAKTTTEKDENFAKMLLKKQVKSKNQWLHESEVGIFSDWFYPVISEMSYLQGFESSAEWIQKRLKFPVAKPLIEKTLDFLQTFKTFKKNNCEQSQFKLKQHFVSHIYKRYNHTQLEMAQKALDTQKVEDRASFTLTVAIDEKRHRILKQRIEAIRHELQNMLIEGESPDRVVQINLHSFLTAQTELQGQE